MNKFRERIYAQYVVASNSSSVPKSMADFACRAPTMHHVINSFFPNEKSAAILDLGCGHGILVHFARQAGYCNSHGIDVSEQQVALAHQLGIDGIREGDLMETLKSTPPSSLDVVVAFDVIEHFTKNELIDFVDAVHRVLKPGGRWIIHAPNGVSLFFGTVRYGDFTHEQAFTPSSLQQLLKASDFSHVEFAECSPCVHGVKSMIRFILWRGIRVLYRFISAIETGDLGQDSVVTRNFYTIAYK